MLTRVQEVMPSMADNDPSQGAQIARLRAAVQGLLNLLPGSGEALHICCTGVVIIKEKAAFAKEAALQLERGNVTERYVRYAYAVAHECVHMAQLLSTGFVVDLGIEFSNVVGQTSAHQRANTPELEWLPTVLRRFRDALRDLNQLSGVENYKFSALQVLELHAIIEGFRGAFSRHTEEGLLWVVQTVHGITDTYADPLGRWLAVFGFDFTFEVVPKLCWLALQTDDPGAFLSDKFCSLLGKNVSSLVESTAIDICRRCYMDEKEIAFSTRKRYRKIRDHPLHALLEPILRLN
jgi:hypothetical protein